MSKLTYRPEIDGLRALAVIAVILFHLDENWLPGGFLGVDFFFVISGFLITHIIIDEILEKKFSFKTFYTRRIKRIYPVFIFTMAIVSFVASLIFTYDDFNQLRKTIELATVFSSNFYLSFRQGYFDLSAAENPVLHIWSLAVEEQFYLIYPIIILLVYKKWKTLKSINIATILLLSSFLLMSFLPNEFYNKINLPNIYYLSHLRFPELLVGALLAIHVKTVRSLTVRNRSFIAFIVLLLISSLFTFNKNLPYIPGVSLIIPCLIVASVIFYGKAKLIQTIFANRTMVFIGKISYSLYLFHWVFIAFAYYISGATKLNQDLIVFIVFFTVLFSVLSYYFIETPFRKMKWNFKKTFIILYLIPSLSLIGYNIYARKQVREAEIKLLSQYKNQLPEYQESKLPAKIITIGDSHATHLKPFLDYIGEKEGWKSDILNVEDCIAMFKKDEDNAKPECQRFWEKISNEQYQAVFISAFYDLKMGNYPVPRFEPQSYVIPDFLLELRKIVSILAKDKKVYVFANNKSLSRYPTRAILLAKYGIDKYLQPIKELGDIKNSNKMIYDAIKDIPNVKWVDAQQYLPDEIFINGIPLYNDQDHLTEFGAIYMAKKYHQHQRLLTPKQVEVMYKELGAVLDND